MAYQAPGRLSAKVNPDVVMMICTAGHVDHGKTALVKLLTGCNTDRLKVEQERGMTIELGFAPCVLGAGNLCVGIVDVPGHEKFVKNMVAGVSGIGMAVLVIAADDGIMPQTIEHFQIMELLGVRHGMIALTKIDLVSPEQVAARTEEIRRYFKGTFLDGAPICPVSSVTFEGYFEFYDVLVREIEKIAVRRRAGIFRMPVERIFTQQGFGTIVSGIPVDGVISTGSQVELVPGGQVGKIRGIQRFARDAAEGGCGQCLAINIPDFSKKPPVRGQVLCEPGYLRASKFLHVDLRPVPGLEKPVGNAESVKFHTGTIETPGKIYLLEDKTLAEGRSSLATIVLAEEAAAAVGDRFILRRPSPAATVAGGEIVAITYGKTRPRKPVILEQMKAYQALLGGRDIAGADSVSPRVEYYLAWERKNGASTAEIARGTLLPISEIKDAIAELEKQGKIITVAPSQDANSDLHIHAQEYRKALELLINRVQQAVESKALSLSAAELRKDTNWPVSLWTSLVEELEKRGKVQRREDKLILPTAVTEMSEADKQLMNRLLRIFLDSGFQTPRPEEIPRLINASPDRVEKMLRFLCNQRQLIRVDKSVILHYYHFKKAQDAVVQAILEKGSLDSVDFKQYMDTSRKYAMAFLDYLDSRKVTFRQMNSRKLMPDYRRNLL